MKNKKLTYALGVLVAVVWGLILYRVFDAVHSNDDTGISPAKAAVKQPYDDYSVPKDTTHLLLNYRDPFGLVKQKDTVKVVMVHRNSKGFKPPLAMDWGFIQYSGYIRNPGSKKLVAIMTVNGKNVMMAEGETTDQVKLLKNLRDSIKISFKGKTKFIVMHTGNL